MKKWRRWMMMVQGRLGFNPANGRYGLLVSDLWEHAGFHCGECLEVYIDGNWPKTRMEMVNDCRWYLAGTMYYGDLEYVKARIREAGMDKIFHRDTLMSGIRVKKKDEKKRKRNIIVNFRVTPEEKRLLDNRIEISGLMKREFFIQSCLHQKINTFGNVKTFDAIRKKLCVVEKHLSEIQKSEQLDLGVLESLRTILEMFDGLDRSGIVEKDGI